MKTPGVYVVEKNAFPNSVVEIETAVPAFIGYTEEADNRGKSLLNIPTKVTSLVEYHRFFGGAPQPKFSITEITDDTPADITVKADDGTAKKYAVAQVSGKYKLYNSIKLFYQNGGGPAYIVSVGKYAVDDASKEDVINAEDLQGDDGAFTGMQSLLKEMEPTMVVIPDAMNLKDTEAAALQQAMVNHCGEKMRNRIAILDIYDGYKDQDDPAGDPVAAFRNIGLNFPDFATAYYPWLNTSIVQDNEISFENLADVAPLQDILKAELGVAGDLTAPADDATPAEKKAYNAKKAIQDLIGTIALDMEEKEGATLSNTLMSLSTKYREIHKKIKDDVNLLPPSGAMAGVYTLVDNSRGVWKAPANVSLNSVVSPTVNISHDEQQDLNVDLNGKSINAIRFFLGEGILVWGARTLDGNSQDWRYINVRRTMIMLEQSIKAAAKAFVFEPNDAQTWTTVKSMIENFLTGQWKKGALVGAVPTDAFVVQVGLGQTMTANDILDGIMRVTVLVAISRPAEFIEITFQQQMQKS